jgi:CTP-dependent riboflavin kinase
VLHDSHLFTLKRGQIIASVAFLCERWEKSNKTVVKYLQMLESEKMIKREVVHRQTPIITICNYELYQDNVQTQVQTQVQTRVQKNTHPPLSEYSF